MATMKCPECGGKVGSDGICTKCGYNTNGKGGGKSPSKGKTPPPSKGKGKTYNFQKKGS